ncbi:hypothetical protein PMAYCL1PPCAC_29954 [Pristionchus mayeri]|uniref:Hydroxymethylglutaryl-CoA synthase n=1 Tax=Pristionchus mayeri TaxID=1317129 RepID=A0AAN5ICP5_9BILA|nr:hypothetical protein PMAYCL1PPCAC_29954 [Pristionchus mayeri]
MVGIFSNGDLPEDFGISGISCYFPKTFVKQNELEKANGIAAGKYTIGLGQTEMAFCSDKEDSVSLALNATQMLLDEYQIDPSSVGFLAVGSETLVDKSKSIMSALMPLFGEDVEMSGADRKHACYGGTQALFDALAWLNWTYAEDHKLAIVVCTDIAVYDEGPARCTGGAGAVALLLSPGAPLVFDRGLQSTIACHSYDFFKPVGSYNCEYPIVAGADSISCYLGFLSNCYKKYKQKSKVKRGQSSLSLADFDAACFHSPFTKLVRKAVAVMVAEDARDGRRVMGEENREEIERLRGSDEPTNLSLISSDALKASEHSWIHLSNPNLEMNRRLGNMYTPSLYVQLVGYLSRLEEERMEREEGKERRILMYSYGSGSIASVFSFTLNEGRTERLKRMVQVSRSIMGRLEERIERTPEEYAETMAQREKFYVQRVPSTPSSLCSPSLHPLFPGSFHLSSIDENNRRHYARTDKKHAIM